MRKLISSKDLKIGMYLDGFYSVSWFKTPFVRNSFVVKSQDEIVKIIEVDTGI